MRLRKQNNPAYDIEREMAELEKGMTELGISFGRDTLEKFKTYLSVLHSYHGRVHLLSHRDYERISRRHFLPCLVALPYVQNYKRICDIGSGAGFPSLPLKIFRREAHLTIFEAQHKKADFLKHLLGSMDLKEVEIVNGRAEEYSGEKFDLALLRAVGKIGKLAGVLDALLKPGAQAIFFKTFNVQEEIDKAQKVLRKHNFQVSIRKTSTPLEKAPLALVILRKT